MTINKECLTQMRKIYDEFTGEEISQAFATIRAERTQKELRNKYQIELLEKQELLKGLE